MATETDYWGEKSLDIDDHGAVYSACKVISAQWRDLGARLGVMKSTLDIIEVNNRGRVEGCMYVVISNWLRRNVLEGADPPTWRNICLALSHIDKRLAKSISMNHDFDYTNPTVPPKHLTVSYVFDHLKHKSAQWDDIGREMHIDFSLRAELGRKSYMSNEDRLHVLIVKWMQSQAADFVIPQESLTRVLEQLEYSDIISAMNREPAPKQLTANYVFDLLKHKSDQWNEIGREMGIDYDDRKRLDRFPKSDENRLKEVIDLWRVKPLHLRITRESLIRLLKQLRFRDILHTMSKERSQIMKLYEENVYNNKRTLKLRAMKGILIGGPGVGKTITFKRLIGERGNIKIDGYSASSGIESPEPIHLYHANASKTSVLIPNTDHDGSWSSKSMGDEFCTFVLQCDKQHRQPHDSAESASSMPIARDRNTSTRFSSFHKSNIIQHHSDRIRNAPSTSATAPAQIDLNKIQTLFSERKYEKIEKVMEGVDELTILYMIDLGGQPEFFEIVPLILRGPSLNLIFVNLSLSLTEQFEVHYRHTPTNCSTISYTSTYSQLQMIRQVLATIASLNESQLQLENSIVESFPTDIASAFLIGTHVDKDNSQNFVTDFEEEVESSLEHAKLYNVLKKLQNKEERSYIFPINNYDGDDEEIRLLRKALTQQISYRFRPIKLPMSWGIFHLLLRKEYEHIGLCSLQEALDLGMKCSIGNEAEVEIVLKFFHLFFGTILYYYDVDALKDRVICDPNLVFKPLSRIIAEAFGANPNDERIVENMRKTGEIPQPVLNRALRIADTILPKSDIIELLKHHNVLATIMNADGNECLFMPCLLKPDDKLVSKACFTNSLLFSFKPHRFQPVGLFIVLIAKLVKLEHFRIDAVVRFRNKVGFFYGNTHVEIRSTVTHIQVLVDEYTRERCVQLHDVLQHEIESIINDLPHMSSTTLEKCFYCPEAPVGSPHIAPLSDPKHLLDSELPKLQCSQCGRAVQLTEEQKMWLEEYNLAVNTDLAMSETVAVPSEDHYLQGAARLSIPETSIPRKRPYHSTMTGASSIPEISISQKRPCPNTMNGFISPVHIFNGVKHELMDAISDIDSFTNALFFTSIITSNDKSTITSTATSHRVKAMMDIVERHLTTNTNTDSNQVLINFSCVLANYPSLIPISDEIKCHLIRSQCPDVRNDVYQLLHSKSAEWDSIARGLNVSPNYRQELKQEGSTSSADAKLEKVFKKWEESTEDRREISWNGVIKALKAENFYDLVDSVESFLRRRSSLDKYLKPSFIPSDL